ncbi:hypothetical protein NC652_037000 [Populus alba x Populus x berolinensis]|uniref:Uncharacterized protein n=1 Tax=Populus alba x Populus x berolinensis TaxID=444605 RepID=A0AAD6LL67_9ROSI|nr:hypothetical protein NC651_035899 [Populus alba x Populus x berolinensis]KAJ6871507.1 hypothetical protein NC652_037000 [Populus alba x Populus x berolinensis]KAJ6969045.1 hypothetical protein NC653_036881 [Populus alba x Populus x berolinensis]
MVELPTQEIYFVATIPSLVRLIILVSY